MDGRVVSLRFEAAPDLLLFSKEDVVDERGQRHSRKRQNHFRLLTLDSAAALKLVKTYKSQPVHGFATYTVQPLSAVECDSRTSLVSRATSVDPQRVILLNLVDVTEWRNSQQIWEMSQSPHADCTLIRAPQRTSVRMNFLSTHCVLERLKELGYRFVSRRVTQDHEQGRADLRYERAIVVTEIQFSMRVAGGHHARFGDFITERPADAALRVNFAWRRAPSRGHGQRVDDVGEQIEDGVTGGTALFRTAPAPLPLPLADPPVGGAIAVGRGNGVIVPARPAQPEPADQGLEMPNVTPQLRALVLVASGLPSFLEGGRLREYHVSGAQTHSRYVLSCTHHERCVKKRGERMETGLPLRSSQASCLPRGLALARPLARDCELACSCEGANSDRYQSWD